MEPMQTQFDNIQELKKEVEGSAVNNAAELEAFRIRFLGTKNVLKDVFSEIKNVPNELKKEFGQRVNELKQLAENRFAELEGKYKKAGNNKSAEIDISLPVAIKNPGSRHPLTIIREELVNIFTRIGYSVVEGPEIEDDWHNHCIRNAGRPSRSRYAGYFLCADQSCNFIENSYLQCSDPGYGGTKTSNKNSCTWQNLSQ